MKLDPKWIIYIAAALALAAGASAYLLWGQEHAEDEAGLIEGDMVKVAAAVAVLAVVAVASFAYLAKNPPGEP